MFEKCVFAKCSQTVPSLYFNACFLKLPVINFNVCSLKCHYFYLFRLPFTYLYTIARSSIADCQSSLSEIVSCLAILV